MQESLNSRLAVLLLITSLHLAGLWWIFAKLAQQPAMPAPSAPTMITAQLLPQIKPEPAAETSQPVPKPETLTKLIPKQQAPKATPRPRTAPSERALPTPQPPAVAALAPAEKSAPPAAALPAPPAAPAAVEAPHFNAAYLNNPPPAYPPLLRRMGEEGKLVLRVHVTIEGAAGEVRIQSSSGSPLFDEAALTAVRQWRFVPARQGDAAVAAWVLVPITFKLN